MGLSSLSDAIWDERHELEGLLARIVALRLILQASEHRFVSTCLDEVQAAAARLATRTAARAALQASTPSTPARLPELVDTAPGALRWVFADHLTSLRDLLAEVDAEASAARRLARNARAQTLEALSIARAVADDLVTLDEVESSLVELGDVMELQLRAQAYRGVFAGLRSLASDALRAFVAGEE